MATILQMYYPGLQMYRICKSCRGSSGENLDRFRCPLCKMNRADYYKAGLEPEVKEYKYLHTTWLKCRGFKMVTTGVRKLDSIIELLFGKPHNENWRNYAKVPVREPSPYVILRTVGESREC